MTTFAVMLHRERRITVELIEAEIARARAVIGWRDEEKKVDHAPEVDRIQELLDEARAMFDAGRVDYAMGLGQAAFEGANALFNALAVAKPVIGRSKSKAGGVKGAERKRGQRTPKTEAIDKAIRAYRGNPRDMASKLATKFDVSRQYVNQRKRKLSVP
jgi:hypothetical protein